MPRRLNSVLGDFMSDRHQIMDDDEFWIRLGHDASHWLEASDAMALFATGVAISLMLIASHARPFTGEMSVGPQLLLQVMPE